MLFLINNTMKAVLLLHFFSFSYKIYFQYSLSIPNGIYWRQKLPGENTLLFFFDINNRLVISDFYLLEKSIIIDLIS